MDWFNAFVRLHTGRFHRSDWPSTPEDTRVFFGDWRADFEANRVRQSEAEAASAEMRDNPPAYRDRHLPTLMAKIKDNRRKHASAGEYHDLPAARAGCRDCPGCGGNGLGTVEHPDSPRGVAAFCWCPAGQMTKAELLKSDPKTAARFRQMERPRPSHQPTPEEHWETLKPAYRESWVAMTAEHMPALARARTARPHLAGMLEAVAMERCHRAEVLGLDPFPEATKEEVGA